MSVSPIGFNALIQRSNDVVAVKQQADGKPMLEQQNIQVQQARQEHELTHKVAKTEEKENDNYRYDAREKGNGSYQQGSKKEHKKEKKAEQGDQVIVKGQSARFDMKI